MVLSKKTFQKRQRREKMNESKVNGIVTNPMTPKSLIVDGKLYTPAMIKELEENNKILEKKLKVASDWISELDLENSSTESRIDNLIKNFNSKGGVING